MFQWNQTYVVNNVNNIETVTNDNGKEVVRIKNATELLKDGIIEVHKSEYVEPVAGSVQIPVTAGDAGTSRRLQVYVRLSGSNNPMFANDLVFKGKPFVYEFKGDSAATDVAKLINKINTIYGENYIVASTSGENLVLTADNYSLFTDVTLEEYKTSDAHMNGGYWEKLDRTPTFTPAVNGFGTYEQIIKDLRLPTVENTGWTSTNAHEMPIPGAKYNQYTITYKNEVGVQGAGHVGDIVTAQTTHAFYVIEAASTTFETAVGKFFNLNIDVDNEESDWTAPAEG